VLLVKRLPALRREQRENQSADNQFQGRPQAQSVFLDPERLLPNVSREVSVSPERSSENKPRETAKSSVNGLRNTLSVLDI
jgi:hypothetical protein